MNREENMGRYQVKLDWDGEVRYGIVDFDHKDGGDKNGNVLVHDAVYPVSYEVPESRLTDIPMKSGRYNPKTGLIEGGDELEE